MTATLAEPFTVPGVYDIPADVYHADPIAGGSLSSSGARKLLTCPAKFRYERDHPPETTKAFDFGHAAHQLVLGAGPEIVVVEANDWRTKAAKEKRDAAHAEGKVPLLEDEWGHVVDMAQALNAHPVAAVLLMPGRGQPEVTLTWVDEATGVNCRAMLDWFPAATPGRRLIVPDYKTTISANPDDLQRAVANYGYHQQAAWYLDGIRALGLAPDGAAFVFVAQEKTAPYLVTVFQLDEAFLAIGADRNRRAREMFRDCTAAGVWPAYPDTDDIATISPPRWLAYQYEESQ